MAQIPWTVKKRCRCTIDKAKEFISLSLSSLNSIALLRRPNGSLIGQLASLEKCLNSDGHIYDDFNTTQAQSQWTSKKLYDTQYDGRRAGASELDYRYAAELEDHQRTVQKAICENSAEASGESESGSEDEDSGERHSGHVNNLKRTREGKSKLLAAGTKGATLSCNNLNGGFHIARISGLIQIHPSCMEDADVCIKAYFARFTLKYLPELKGVWVSTGRYKLDDDHFNTADAEKSGIATCRIQANILIFSPLIGSRLIGKVTQVRASHIGLLCYGCFNVCIQRVVLNKYFSYQNRNYVSKEAPLDLSGAHQSDTTVENPVDSTPDNTIRNDGWIQFTIIRRHFSGGGALLSIDGAQPILLKTYTLGQNQNAQLVLKDASNLVQQADNTHIVEHSGPSNQGNAKGSPKNTAKQSENPSEGCGQQSQVDAAATPPVSNGQKSPKRKKSGDKSPKNKSKSTP